MKLADRIALIKAGYTKEEILGFINDTEEKEDNSIDLLGKLEELTNTVNALQEDKASEQADNIKGSEATKNDITLDDVTNFIMGGKK